MGTGELEDPSIVAAQVLEAADCKQPLHRLTAPLFGNKRNAAVVVVGKPRRNTEVIKRLAVIK